MSRALANAGRVSSARRNDASAPRAFAGLAERHAAARPRREPPRQREQLRDFRLRAVERGVEARHLRHGRHRADHRPDRREVVRLVQRRERHQSFEFREHLGVDPHRRRCTSPRRGRPGARPRPVGAPPKFGLDSGRRPTPAPGRARRRAPDLHHVRGPTRRSSRDREGRELEARRTGVQNQDGVSHQRTEDRAEDRNRSSEGRTQGGCVFPAAF